MSENPSFHYSNNNIQKRLYTFCFSGLACILLLPGAVVWALGMPESAQAVFTQHTTMIHSGGYTLDVTLSQDPPFTDQPFTVLVAVRNGALPRGGQVIAQPGLGTDGANVYATLHPVAGHPDRLQATLRIPVRGAWHIVVAVNSASGQASGSVDVVAAAPGAMPVWLAWSIGAIPALGLLLWSLRQRRFRRRLVFDQ